MKSTKTSAPECSATKTPATANGEFPRHDSLDAALLAAQREIESVTKGATNTHHGYAYASADMIVSDCRKVLNRHGIVIMALDAPTDVAEDGKRITAQGIADAPRAIVRMVFHISHPDSKGERKAERSMIAEAEKGRPIDKAILGAQTSLWGYFLRDLLALPRFTDDEISARSDKHYDPNVLGKEAERNWLRPRCSELSISSDFLRKKMVAGGVPAAEVAGTPDTWPRTLMPRIEKFLASHKARYGPAVDPQARKDHAPHQDIRQLPQREDAPRPTPAATTRPITRPNVGANGKPEVIHEDDIPF